MIFAVLDPSPLTVCINCSFFTFIIIMFVYSIDDITRNLRSTSVTQGGNRLYTEGLSSAKFCHITAHNR